MKEDPHKKYQSYIVDINLPEAIIVPPIPLTLVYVFTLILDYTLIKNDTKLSINPTHLRYIIFIYHFLLPIIFATKYNFGNISFMLQPWTSAAQVVFLAKSSLTLREWIPMMFKIAIFQDDSPTTDAPQQIRMQGLTKLSRGLTKFAFMKLVLDGVLPEDLSDLLALPFYDLKALWITYILAVRIYCMLGVSDILMGVVQALFLVRFKDVFNNPFMASSPKDFWNKRWNRIVSNMFSTLIFSTVKSKAKEDKKKDEQKRSKAVLFNSPTMYGLLIFIISGLFHDFMIAAATRTITFELTAFFLFHGIVVALEANYRTGKYKQDPTGLNFILCHLLTVLFFTTTGRLFLNPILRQPVFLKIAQQF